MKNKIYIAFLIVIFSVKNSFALIEVDITMGNLKPLPIAVSPLHVEVKSSDHFEGIDIGSEISKVVETSNSVSEAVSSRIIGSELSVLKS